MFRGIIYSAYNNVTRKGYVGQTQRPLLSRWNGHCNGKRSILSKAILKYGKDCWDVGVLEHLKVDKRCELHRIENKWIEKLETYAPKGYNALPRGRYIEPTPEKWWEDYRHIIMEAELKANAITVQSLTKSLETGIIESLGNTPRRLKWILDRILPWSSPSYVRLL